jgi:hypothetical protein
MKRIVIGCLKALGLMVLVLYVVILNGIVISDAVTVNKQIGEIQVLQATYTKQQKALASLQQFQDGFPTNDVDLFTITHPWLVFQKLDQ